MAVGKLKQFGLMYWLCPKPEAGLHVRIGLSWISLVPRIETLLTLKTVPGILAPFRPILKFALLLKPARLAPLWTWVMPDSCHPLMNPPAILSFTKLPSSIE